MTPQEQLSRQIEFLERLAVIDAQIRRIDLQLAQEQGQLSTLKEKSQRLDGRLAVDRKSVEEMQKTIGELMIEARQMMQQIDRSREKLGRARNERETMAAQRELEELRKLVRDREEDIGKLTALVDEAKRSIDDADEQKQTIVGRLSSEESGMSESIRTMITEREEKLAARAELGRHVTSVTFRRYDAIRQKRGTALAKVVKETCLACHMAIPPQMLQRLRRQEALDQCPHCQRILYWAPAVALETDDEEAKG